MPGRTLPPLFRRVALRSGVLGDPRPATEWGLAYVDKLQQQTESGELSESFYYSTDSRNFEDSRDLPRETVRRALEEELGPLGYTVQYVELEDESHPVVIVPRDVPPECRVRFLCFRFET